MCFVCKVSLYPSVHRLQCITFAYLPMHCDTAADQTLISSVPAKKHEASQAPASHVVSRHTAAQSTAPKFGSFMLFLHSDVYFSYHQLCLLNDFICNFLFIMACCVASCSSYLHYRYVKLCYGNGLCKLLKVQAQWVWCGVWCSVM